MKNLIHTLTPLVLLALSACGGFSVNKAPLAANLSSTSATMSVPNQSLKMTSISPMSFSAAGGTKLTILGSGFTSSTKVSIDGISCASVQLMDATQLTCMSPSLSEGPKKISLSDIATISQVTFASALTIIPAAAPIATPTPVPAPMPIPVMPPAPAPTPLACTSGFILYMNSCVATSRTCVVTHGSGTQNFMNGNYSACAAVSCEANYQIDPFSKSCQLIAGLPSGYAAACPTTIPRGQITHIQFGARDLTNLSVFDGATKVLDYAATQGGISVSVELSPQQTTTYDVVLTGDKGIVHQQLVITVLDSSDPSFKYSSHALTASPLPYSANPNTEDAFTRLLNWTPDRADSAQYIVTAQTALGTELVYGGYLADIHSLASVSNLRSYSSKPVTYTVMSCDQYFGSKISEIASVKVPGAQLALTIQPSAQAECHGNYVYTEASGVKRIGLIESGTGNINGTGAGTNEVDCAKLMADQQDLCTQQFGPCDVTGYLEVMDPNLKTPVSFRIFPLSSRPRTIAGVCEATYSTTSKTLPSVSSGPSFLVSYDSQSLIDDCKLDSWQNRMGIDAQSATGTLQGAQTTGISSITLVDLQSNQALLNLK